MKMKKLSYELLLMQMYIKISNYKPVKIKN